MQADHSKLDFYKITIKTNNNTNELTNPQPRSPVKVESNYKSKYYCRFSKFVETRMGVEAKAMHLTAHFVGSIRFRAMKKIKRKKISSIFMNFLKTCSDL